MSWSLAEGAEGQGPVFYTRNDVSTALSSPDLLPSFLEVNTACTDEIKTDKVYGFSYTHVHKTARPATERVVASGETMLRSE